MKRFLFALTIGALTFSAHAVSINIADLPNAVQSCISTSQCFVNTSSSFEQQVSATNSIAAFQWTDLSSGTPVNKYLIRYQLDSGSSNVYSGVDSYGNPTPTQTTSLSGNLWMGINSSYAISAPDLSTQYATMNLFLDQTQVDTNSNAWLQPPSPDGVLTLRMNYTDLLNGSAFSAATCCSNGGIITGSLQTSDGFGGWQSALPCLADGCSSSAMLNLIDLQYTLSGPGATLLFNSTDTRGLLYTTTLNDPYSGDGTSTYLVAPVPVPASAWLFVSGLFGLISAVRHRRT